MATNMLEIRDKVRRYLTDLVPQVDVDAEGNFSFQQGSTRVRIAAFPLENDSSIILIEAPLLMGVTPSPELYRYVATHSANTLFGYLRVHESEDGLEALLLLSASLLGDKLDREELQSTVTCVALGADDLDDKLQDRFGGTKWYDN